MKTVIIIRRWQWLLLTIPLVLVVSLAWYIGQTPLGKIDQVEMTLSQTDEGELAATNLNLVQTEQGKPIWTLSAPRADRSAKAGVIHVFDPDLTLYRKRGAELTVTSRLGSVNEKTRFILFEENVIVQDEIGRQLTTERLQFDPDKGLLSTDLSFRFVGPRLQLEGVGMRLHRNSRHLTVLSNARFSHLL